MTWSASVMPPCSFIQANMPAVGFLQVARSPRCSSAGGTARPVSVPLHEQAGRAGACIPNRPAALVVRLPKHCLTVAGAAIMSACRTRNDCNKHSQGWPCGKPTTLSTTSRGHHEPHTEGPALGCNAEGSHEPPEQGCNQCARRLCIGAGRCVLGSLHCKLKHCPASRLLCCNPGKWKSVADMHQSSNNVPTTCLLQRAGCLRGGRSSAACA